jgi:hypothetical protein
MIKMTVTEAIEKANEFMAQDKGKYIHAGMERKVAAKKRDDKKTYIRIDCYTLGGNYKGNYKCGKIDADGNYSVGQYDEIDLEKMEYIGR